MSNLSRYVGDLLIQAVELHTKAAARSIEQGAELVERADCIRQTSGDDAASPERRQFLATLGSWRATYELESATHAAALTQVACTFALLESAGVDVGRPIGAALNADFLDRIKAEETAPG